MMNENLESETPPSQEIPTDVFVPTPEMIVAVEAQRARLRETELNPGLLTPEAKELLEKEEKLIREAVESAPTVEALAQFVETQVLFYGREPVEINGRNYTYSQAIRDAGNRVLDLAELPNAYGIQDKLRSLGILEKNEIN